MIGQLAHATGCSPEEAEHLLRENRWQLEAAISAWFMPSPLPQCCSSYRAQSETQQIPQLSSQHQALCPCNTPATPPSFADTIHAFQKLDWRGSFPDK